MTYCFVIYFCNKKINICELLDICWVPDLQYLTNASSGEGKKAVILDIDKMVAGLRSTCGPQAMDGRDVKLKTL